MGSLEADLLTAVIDGIGIGRVIQPERYDAARVRLLLRTHFEQRFGLPPLIRRPTTKDHLTNHCARTSLVALCTMALVGARRPAPNPRISKEAGDELRARLRALLDSTVTTRRPSRVSSSRSTLQDRNSGGAVPPGSVKSSSPSR